MKKTFVASALGLILSQQVVTAHAANIEPYYLVEEIPFAFDSDNVWAGLGRYDFNVTAVSDDGTLVAGRSLAFFTHFNFLDFFNRTTFDYGCQYSNDVCRNFNDSTYGFDEFYRRALVDQRSKFYESKFLGFWTDLSTGPTYDNSNSNQEPVPTYSQIEEKTRIYDDVDTTTSTDTQINDIQRIGGDVWLTGWASAPFSLSDSGRYTRDFIGRGFAKNATTGQVISLLPCNSLDSSACNEEALQGGASVGTKLIYPEGNQVPGYEGKTIVIGYASYRYIDGSSSYFNDCQTGNRNDYARCFGLDTQAWVWDITEALSDPTVTEVTGEQFVSNFARREYGEPPKYNIIDDIGSEGTMVGMSSRDEFSNRSGSRGRAVFLEANEPDENGEVEIPFKVVQVPNLGSGNANPGSDDYRDTISHTWSTAVNDTARLIVGNMRFSTEKGRNRAVEGFVFENDGSNIAMWPFRDQPFRGGNSYFSDVNSEGLVVGWRDADGEVQPSQNGTTRRQTGLLLDYDAYKAGQAVSSWSLVSLTCYEDDDGQSLLPLYRIEYANSIDDDGTIIASGYHYANSADFINRANPRPVLLRLVRNDESIRPPLDDLAQCPQLEEQPSERSGGSMGWLALLLLPVAFVRQFKFAKNAPKA